MGHISSLFVEKLAVLAAPSTHSQDTRTALCHFVGIDPKLPPEPGRMISDSTFFRLLEHVAADYEDGRSIGIRLGATMRCDDYGAFGLAFKSAVDLWGSFQRVERYGKIVTSIANFYVENRSQSSLMAVRPDDGTRLGLRMTNELAVSAATALSREVHPGEFAPLAVTFRHDAPQDLSAYASHFRCPVQFGATTDGLEVSEQVLHAGNRLGDAQTSDFIDKHLDEQLRHIEDDVALDQQVRRYVTNSLSEGPPRVADIATQMGMSSRTLQRRLAAEGCVYQALVDTARRDLAEQLLRQTDFALAEVAFLTGYSEQSTFARAFKRWYGQTPANYRRTAANR